jgi:hypothetical protein
MNPASLSAFADGHTPTGAWFTSQSVAADRPPLDGWTGGDAVLASPHEAKLAMSPRGLVLAVTPQRRAAHAAAGQHGGRGSRGAAWVEPTPLPPGSDVRPEYLLLDVSPGWLAERGGPAENEGKLRHPRFRGVGWSSDTGGRGPHTGRFMQGT